jgi:hypothetical protein
MTDDAFETSVRKFLKQVGVTAHQKLADTVAEGGLAGRKVATARAVITLEGTGLQHVVEGEITLPGADG